MTRLCAAERNYRFSRAYNAREFPWHYTEATTAEVRAWLRNYRKWVHIAANYSLRARQTTINSPTERTDHARPRATKRPPSTQRRTA